MSLSSNVADLATRVATEIKAKATQINGNAPDLSALTTTAKTNLVAAINEVNSAVAGSSGIDDGATGTSTTWSSSKISGEISDAVAAVPDPADLINDAAASTASVYSSTKTDAQIAAAVAGVDLTDLINDAAPSASTVYSSNKVTTDIAAAVAGLVDGAPGDLDTLNELAAALADDDSAITAINTALGNRVRTDTAAQGLTSTQQGNARTNIAAAAAADVTALAAAVGDTDADFAATFVAGLS